MSRPTPLNERALGDAVRVLAAADPDLAAVVAAHGPPPLWSRPPGFATLIHIILEQQVSLASAQAAFDRLLAAASPLTPARFLALNDDALLAIGFSRQKRAYGRGLAHALRDGRLDLHALADLPDDAVRERLTRLKGIGPWTADIYLMEALLRPDVWPVGDLALAQAVREVKGLAERPSGDALRAIGEPWRPWRAVAARILWHDYLSRRGTPVTWPNSV